MKTMTTLHAMATDLATAVSSHFDEENKDLVVEFLDVGEEGLAVLYSLRAAIDTATDIPEPLWENLVTYFTEAPTELSKSIRQLLGEVRHAA